MKSNQLLKDLEATRSATMRLILADIERIAIPKFVENYKSRYLRGIDRLSININDLCDVLGYRSKLDLRMEYTKQEVDSGMFDEMLAKQALCSNISSDELRLAVNPGLKKFGLICLDSSDEYNDGYLRIVEWTKYREISTKISDWLCSLPTLVKVIGIGTIIISIPIVIGLIARNCK